MGKIHRAALALLVLGTTVAGAPPIAAEPAAETLVGSYPVFFA
jgi:hypothetical protein